MLCWLPLPFLSLKVYVVDKRIILHFKLCHGANPYFEINDVLGQFIINILSDTRISLQTTWSIVLTPGCPQTTHYFSLQILLSFLHVTFFISTHLHHHYCQLWTFTFTYTMIVPFHKHQNIIVKILLGTTACIMDWKFFPV